MQTTQVTDGVFRLSANVHDILFEGMWPIPHGFSMNSYIVKGDKVAIIDGVCDWDGTPEVLFDQFKYFLNLFESGMRDAANATHALEGIRPKALEVLLAFIYEGKCQIDEGQLTEVLEASARLVVDDLKEACAGAIGARLAPSNALVPAGRGLLCAGTEIDFTAVTVGAALKVVK